MVVYDDHGAYGHPDHVQVHRVGIRAAALAGTPVVYEATFDRDRMVAQLRALQADGLEGLPDEPPDEGLGVSSELITTRIDVSAQADVKRRAMGCHRSQIGETSFFLSLRGEQFAAVFGIEEFIRRGARAGAAETALDLSSTIGRLD